jgi:hypothetical protein
MPHVEMDSLPLAGKNACGLHIPINLRVITRFENRSKGPKIPKEKRGE